MPKAKYEDIYVELKKRIETERYRYGELLPSENTLITHFNCSRNTVRRALAILTDEGCIQPIHGKGVRVIYQPTKKATFTVGGIESFQETAARNNLQVSTKVVALENIVADEKLSLKSGFETGQELIKVCRVRVLDDKAAIMDINYFNADIVTGLTKEIASSSIYEYLENTLNLQITISKRQITVEHATTFDKKHINLDCFNCLAVIKSQTFNSDGVQFEYTESRHHPEYFCFQTTAVRKK